MVSRMTRGLVAFAFASAMGTVLSAQIPEPPTFVVAPPPSSKVRVANDKSIAASLPTGSLGPALTLLGLNPCDYSKSYANGEPSGAIAMVGNPEVDCATWRLSEATDVTVFSGSVTVNESRLPIVAFYDSRDLVHSIPRRIVVEVIGGPGMDISPGLNDYLPLLLVERGVLVVRVGYTGTRHGSSFPGPDLENAAYQVRSYVSKLRQLHPQGKIVLLGDSLGGMISAKAAGDLPSATLDGLALILPLVFSADDAAQNFNDIFSARNEKPRVSEPIRIIKSPQNPWPAGRVATVPGIDLFRSFFPQAARHRNLESYLAKTVGVKKMLAFGDIDERTGNSGVASIRNNILNIEFIKLERNGHLIEKWVAQRLADRMWDLLLK